MSEILISARQARPRDTSDATAPVSLDLVSNSDYGFIGPDNTLISAWMQMLAAIEPPACGEVRFLEQGTTHPAREQWQQLRINLAYLNHRSALLSVLSTEENILLPALYHGLGSREALKSRMYELLGKIGFNDMANLARLPAYLDELSYSQALLVRVVLTEPRVIVIDNTLRHFDQRRSRKMLDFLRQHVASMNGCLLLHDDDTELVLNTSRQFIYIDHDGLSAFSSRTELESSSHPAVLHFLNEIEPH